MKKLKVNMFSESEYFATGHGVHTAYVEMAAALRKRPDVDVVTKKSRPDADITHVHTIGLYSLARILYGPGKKVVSAHVVPDSVDGSIILGKYWKSHFGRYMRRFYGKADLVLAVSEGVKDELEQDMGLKNVKLLYNTINMSHYKTTAADKIKARKKLGIVKDAFMVVGNGQVQPRKRLDSFIDAARKLPDVAFVWIGGIPFKRLGAEYNAMQKLIQGAPGNVKVTNLISIDVVRDYLRAADMFYLPAEQENHPLAVLEAAGVGLPIMLRDIPQYHDTFAGDAVFVRTDAQAIKTIQRLRDDKSFYHEQSAGSRRIAERFDSKTGAEQLVELYRSLL